jgi:metallo-beta-lactamase superfamily protein
MSAATDLHRLSSTLHVWQRYAPSLKADLFSTAVETVEGFFLVDPIQLKRKSLESFIVTRPVAGVVITNENHARAAMQFGRIFGAPIFAHMETIEACKLRTARKVTDGSKLADDLHVIEIPGAAAGEIALHHRRRRGAIIVGDALINFEPYGFSFLPAKYCCDRKQMRWSLRRLLDYDFDQLLFAHGIPLIHSARERLEELLERSK